MLDLVVQQYQHHRQAAPRYARMGRERGGGAEDRKGEGFYRSLTLVESTAREFERGQTEI